MRLLIASLTLIWLSAPCLAAIVTVPFTRIAPYTKGITVPMTSLAPAKTAAVKKAAVKTEAELSGATSETADNIYARINYNRKSTSRQLFVRSGYGLQTNRSYNSSGKVSKQNTDTYNLDAQYRIEGRDRYRFLSAYVNVKNLTPANKKIQTSGYYSFAIGVGRKFAPGFESELSLATVRTYDKTKMDEITLIHSLRMKRDLTSATILDADIRIINPFADEPLMDSRINLTYKLTDRIGIRLTQVANNLLTPNNSKSGWDKSVRLALTFSSTN